MDSLDPFINQLSQSISKVFEECSQLVEKIFSSGIVNTFITLLKSAGRLLVAALEALIRILNPLIK